MSEVLSVETMAAPAAVGLIDLSREHGFVPYLPLWHAMRAFTDQRNSDSQDQLLLLQHEPVFTLGQAGKPEHVLLPGDIPVVQCDRGGQVTYHGPGQLVLYPLLDLQRLRLGVRDFVCLLEQVIIDTLAAFQISARRRDGMPGVYVGEDKIAALGLRVRRGCSYHGLAFNVDMDLQPFSRINPCGYAGMQVTDLRRCCGVSYPGLQQVQQKLLDCLQARLGVALQTASAAEPMDNIFSKAIINYSENA